MADEDPRSTADHLVVLIDPCLDEADTLILNGIDPVEFLREWREWRAEMIVEEILHSKQIAAAANSSKQLGGVNETATGEAPPASDDPRANPAVQAAWEAKINSIAATLDKTPPPTVTEIEVAIQSIQSILAQATVSDSLKAIANTKLTMLQYETGMIRARQKHAASSTGNRFKRLGLGISVLLAMVGLTASVVPASQLVEYAGTARLAPLATVTANAECRREGELIADYIEDYRAKYRTSLTDVELENVMRASTTDKQKLADARIGCRTARNTLEEVATEEAASRQPKLFMMGGAALMAAIGLYAIGDASSKEGEAKVLKIITDGSKTLVDSVGAAIEASTTKQIADSRAQRTALAQVNQSAMSQSRQLEAARAAQPAAVLSSFVETGMKTFTSTGSVLGSLAAGVGAGALKAIASSQELSIQEQVNAAANTQRKLAAIQGLPQPTISALPSPGIEAAAATAIDSSLTALEQRVQNAELDQKMTDIRNYKLRCDALADSAEREFTVVEGLVTAMGDSATKTTLGAGLKTARTDLTTLKAKLESFNLKLPAEGASVTRPELDKLTTDVTGFRTSLTTIITILEAGKNEATPRKKGQQSQIPAAPATPVTPQGGRRGGAPTVDPPAPGGSLDETDQFILNSLLEDEVDIDVLVEVRRKLLTPTSSTGARRRTYRKRLGRRTTRAHGAVTA